MYKPFLLTFCNKLPFFFIVNEGFEIWEIHEVKYEVILQEGEIHLVPNCPTSLFKKIILALPSTFQQFVIRKSISWICKRYFMNFRFNNVYANIGLALFKVLEKCQ